MEPKYTHDGHGLEPAVRMRRRARDDLATVGTDGGTGRVRTTTPIATHERASSGARTTPLRGFGGVMTQHGSGSVLAAVTAACLAAATLVGCGVTEGNWPDKYADSFCNATESCEAAVFDADYSNADDCRATVAGGFDPEAVDGCEFNSENAQDCLDALDRFAASCGDHDATVAGDQCGDVYDCRSVGGNHP